MDTTEIEETCELLATRGGVFDQNAYNMWYEWITSRYQLQAFIDGEWATVAMDNELPEWFSGPEFDHVEQRILDTKTGEVIASR
jgi:hypothetical protein